MSILARRLTSASAICARRRAPKLIIVPIAWFPRLLDATPAERHRWESVSGGYGIHWPDLNKDLPTKGLLRGAPAARR